MKPPDHPVPSGDRMVARLFLAALARAGHDVRLVSRFRSRDGRGERAKQQDLIKAAAAERNRLSDEFGTGWSPDLWFTYHLYYKAPDLLGPPLADALSIPYLAAEVSHASKRRKGPWADFCRLVETAIAGADHTLATTRADRQALAELVPDERLTLFPPFTATRPRPPQRVARNGNGPVRLLVIAMMRRGDKLMSYRLLGQALRRLDRRLDWHLTVVGGGPAAADVRHALAPARNRITFRGQVPVHALPGIMRSHDLMIWPAVNEAFGMALLDAAALGLPVVAGRFGGVPDIVDHGASGWLTAPGNATDFARGVDRLIRDDRQRRRMADQAWRRVTRRHGLVAASHRLDRILRSALDRHSSGDRP